MPEPSTASKVGEPPTNSCIHGSDGWRLLAACDLAGLQADCKVQPSSTPLVTPGQPALAVRRHSVASGQGAIQQASPQTRAAAACSLLRSHSLHPLQPAHLIAGAGVREEVLDGNLGRAWATPQVSLGACVCIQAVRAGGPDLLAHSPAAATGISHLGMPSAAENVAPQGY